MSKMEEKKKIPEIRFEGFGGEWKQCHLGEVGGLKNGMNFGKEAMGHGYPFVNLQDVFGKNTVDNTNLELAISNEKQRKEYSLEKGDVLFIRSSVKPEGVGEAALVSESFKNTTYSGFIIRFRPNIEMSGNFNRFIYSTISVRKQILTSATSSANTNINQDALKKIQLTLPKIGEQTKIGNYFQQLDTLITLHKKKHDKLLNVKKAMLEKMFPKKGADMPEIRFKGFSEKWEERALGELCADTYGGGTPRTSEAKYWNGDIPWIQSSDLSKEQVSNVVLRKNITTNGLRASATKLIPANSIAIVTRVGVGKLAFIPFKYATSQDFLSLSKLKINNWYGVYSIWKKLQDELHAIQGTSIKGITKEELLAKRIIIPMQNTEQTKIGNFFKHLDTLLVLHQTELTCNGLIKQGTSIG
ncbi:MAG: type I restriction enzyme, S subunit [Methyloprofundus sp.]|nr:MAG: type I restriction enzyme, S subunit [Methyloprofundus sp.]